jgi:hypothetical protein
MELTVSNGVNANSAMLDFASTMAPAARMRCTMNASRCGIHPCSESDPAVVGRSVVWKLSFTMTGMQCSAPRLPPAAAWRSSESATASARGFTTMSELSAGPVLSYAAIRSRYPCTTAWQVTAPERSAACTAGMVVSTTSKRARGRWAPAVATARVAMTAASAVAFMVSGW